MSGALLPVTLPTAIAVAFVPGTFPMAEAESSVNTPLPTLCRTRVAALATPATHAMTAVTVEVTNGESGDVRSAGRDDDARQRVERVADARVVDVERNAGARGEEQVGLVVAGHIGEDRRVGCGRLDAGS